MADISGKDFAHFQHLAYRDIALHDEAVVQTDQRFDPRTDQQVIANSHLGHSIPYIIQHDIQERSIQHDVAVIRNKGTRLFILRQTATTGYRQRESGFSGHHHHGFIGQLVLEVFLCFKGAHRFAELLPIHIRLYIPKGPLKIFIGNQRFDRVFHLVVI